MSSSSVRVWLWCQHRPGPHRNVSSTLLSQCHEAVRPHPVLDDKAAAVFIPPEAKWDTNSHSALNTSALVVIHS